MKQIISRCIQICLIVAAFFWIYSSSITQSFINSFDNGNDCVPSTLVTEEQRQNVSRFLITKIEQQNDIVNTKIEKGDFDAYDYFKHIKYLDSLEQTTEFQYLVRQGPDYSRLHYLANPSMGNSIFKRFNDLVRSRKISSEEIEDARDSVMGTKKSDPITWAEVSTSLTTLARKIFNNYLFFGFLILFLSLNKIWRNPLNESLFDPRNRKQFICDLLIWPIRLWFWFKGEVTIRQYGDKPLRALSKKEKDLLDLYVRNLGRVSMSKYFYQRNIKIQRSFFVSMLILVFCSSFVKVLAYNTPLGTRTDIAHVVYDNGPPDWCDSCDTGVCCVEDYQQTYAIFHYLQEDNIGLLISVMVKHVYRYFFLIKEVYLDTLWNPPKNSEVNFVKNLNF
ncbi:MAG: hypothetical protein MRY57_02860 [Candidatus Pacebacteria bacterium]|nr:hypothetical protein [Candidatus Paceibacterota bacterium]